MQKMINVLCHNDVHWLQGHLVSNENGTLKVQVDTHSTAHGLPFGANSRLNVELFDSQTSKGIPLTMRLKHAMIEKTQGSSHWILSLEIREAPSKVAAITEFLAA